MLWPAAGHSALVTCLDVELEHLGPATSWPDSVTPVKPTMPAAGIPIAANSGKAAYADLVGRHGPGRANVEWTDDEAVTQAEPADARNRVVQADRPVMLEKHKRCCRVGRHLVQDVPRPLGGEDLGVIGCHQITFICIGPRSDDRIDPDRGLDWLVGVKASERPQFDPSVCILKQGDRVNQTHYVFGAQTGKLGDDVPVKIRVVECENDQQLKSPDTH